MSPPQHNVTGGPFSARAGSSGVHVPITKPVLLTSSVEESTMIRTVLAASLAAAAVLVAAPAFADDDDNRREYRVASSSSVNISRAEALRIAREHGLSRLEEIELDDGEWEIEGRTRNGREIEIDISARTGQVLELEIDD
jgi:uncharacterized membrane protein YkoI